jgi:hypothetical protein
MGAVGLISPGFSVAQFFSPAPIEIYHMLQKDRAIKIIAASLRKLFFAAQLFY